MSAKPTMNVNLFNSVTKGNVSIDAQPSDVHQVLNAKKGNALRENAKVTISASLFSFAIMDNASIDAQPSDVRQAFNAKKDNAFP